MSVVPRIRTGRLLLREWVDDDLAPFAAMNADAEVMHHIREPLTREESDRFAERTRARWSADGHGLWALEVQESGRFIGFAGLVVQTFEASFNPSVEVGWRLARDAWGHGYATEAGEASIAFGFEVLELDEIVSMTTAANTRSMAVMRRLGMTRDPSADYEQEWFPPGHPLRAAVLHRLSRDTWAARHPRA